MKCKEVKKRNAKKGVMIIIKLLGSASIDRLSQMEYINGPYGLVSGN